MTPTTRIPEEPYYADDFVTLYHGDCRDIAPFLEGVTALITDPPYGISWDVGDVSFRAKNRARRGQQYAPIVGDDAPFDPSPWLAYPRVALFGANHYADKLPASPAWVVWDKRVRDWSNDQSDCELVWTNGGGRARIVRKAWSGGGTIRKENGHRGGKGASVTIHPSQKPVDVMRQVILWVAEPDDLILDPFAGSGSTCVAAKSLGRRSIGIEIDERYLEWAATRCSQEVLGLPA